MSVNIPNIVVVCGNKKCRYTDNEPSIEFNFFTKELVYVCSKCGHDMKMALEPKVNPLPRTRIG